MDQVLASDIEWVPAPEENFTGKVWFGPMAKTYGSGQGVSVLGVQFAPGSRTDWHSHPGGQVLHGITGHGVVVNQHGEKAHIYPGATVTSPADELHWHGAVSDSPMMHLSITHGGETKWDVRKVTDEEYSA